MRFGQRFNVYGTNGRLEDEATDRYAVSKPGGAGYSRGAIGDGPGARDSPAPTLNYVYAPLGWKAPRPHHRPASRVGFVARVKPDSW